jgi:hypothetical protein
VASNGHDYEAAVSDTVISAAGFMLLALLMATTEIVRRRVHHGPRLPPGAAQTEAVANIM